jgi:hypothetical protein
LEVKEVVFKYSRPDVFKIIPFGDQHLGTMHCYENGIIRKIKQIQDDPFTYWIDMGDSCECITPGDKRWDGGVISDWLHPDNIATDQVNHYCELFSPIKDKCIGKLAGNHEQAIKQHNFDNVQKNICDKLGITDLGYSCFIRFIFRRGKESHSYTGMFTHGSGAAITAGSKMQRLQRLMDNFDADIVAQGHTHDLLTYVKPYLKLTEGNEIRQRVKVGAMTGCWFRTYTQGVSASYGEQKNYSPVMLGSPTFTIVPDKDILRVEG